MNKKIFLTSIIALGFACPAMAESFPSGGLMQENKTYDNAATESNMAGVYEGSVYANAQYEDVLYQLAAGKYLPANSETPIDCDQNGYYCGGDPNGVYYSSSAQGLSQCPNGYANSGTGASANTDCYRTCVNNDVAHSTGTVNGGVYYNGTDGDGNKTCEPTDCVSGYHVKSGNPDLMTLIGVSDNGNYHGYLSNNGTYSDATGIYSISHNGEFVVEYNNGDRIRGMAQCSSRSATNSWVGTDYAYVLQSDGTTATLPDSDGNYCYCHLDSYTPYSPIYGYQTSIDLTGPWVIYGRITNCASGCASNCGSGLREGQHPHLLAFRAAMFNVYQPSLASCAANTITINWNGTTQTEIDANEAGTATYGGNIRTPRSATHVDGKRFTGWIFSTTAPSNGNE